jgi:hypothetical protein
MVPAKCGREEIIQGCFNLLGKRVSREFAHEVLTLMMAYSSGSDLSEYWIALRNRGGKGELSNWLYYGLRLGSLRKISVEQLAELLPEQEVEASIGILYRARRLDFLESTETRFTQTLDAILDSKTEIALQRRVESALDAVSHAINPSRYALAFATRVSAPLTSLLEHRNRLAQLRMDPNTASPAFSYARYSAMLTLATVATEESEKPAAVWAAQIGPWDRVVETGRSLFGERWCFDLLANVAAGIKSVEYRAPDAADLLDTEMSLCQRVRHARLRYNSTTWWSKQLEAVKSGRERRCVLLVLLSWAAPQTIVSVLDLLPTAVDRLTQSEWETLCDGLQQSQFLRRKLESGGTFDAKGLPVRLGIRTGCVLILRSVGSSSEEIYKKYLSQALTKDPIVHELVLREALDLRHFGGKSGSQI